MGRKKVKINKQMSVCGLVSLSLSLSLSDSFWCLRLFLFLLSLAPQRDETK